MRTADGMISSLPQSRIIKGQKDTRSPIEQGDGKKCIIKQHKNYQRSNADSYVSNPILGFIDCGTKITFHRFAVDAACAQNVAPEYRKRHFVQGVVGVAQILNRKSKDRMSRLSPTGSQISAGNRGRSFS